MLTSAPRILSLDGGGVRGLSSLLILQQLMESIDPEAQPPPKPCDYFDLIGGTSTGGLIAIMLGRLEMDVKACIRAYTDLSDKVFQKKRHRVSLKLGTQGRFDSEELEEAIKRILVEQGLDQDTRLIGPPDAKCKVFVCATSGETRDIVLLRSYSKPPAPSRDVKIWEAGRATSAAPSFFDPIAVGAYKETFVDGALGANNPIDYLWHEARDLWPSLEGSAACVVSVGTGTPSTKSFQTDIFQIGPMLAKMLTECERTAEKFAKDKRGLVEGRRYFRFNVQDGLGDVSLEASKDMKFIAAATHRYIERFATSTDLWACAVALQKDHGRVQHLKTSASFQLQGSNEVNLFSIPIHVREEYLQVCNNYLIAPRMHARFDHIKTFPKSEWLLEHEFFRNWNDCLEGCSPLSGFLNLKGNPGAGKSVVMKEAVIAEWSRQTNDGFSVTLHHFFGDSSFVEGQGSASADDAACVYRSLFGQLINQVPKKPWHDILQLGKELREQRGTSSWSLERLQGRIMRLILENKTASNGQPMRFRIFIDKINECAGAYSEGRVAAKIYAANHLGILKFASRLVEDLVANGVDIGVCISRQYVPSFGQDEPKGQTIQMEKHNGDAIEAFVVQQLGRLDNCTLERRLYHKLKPRFADGFLWATLVTEAILVNSDKEYEELAELIKRTPPSFEQMYQRILGNIKVEGKGRSLQFFQIALAMLKPMSSDQFRQACAFSSPFDFDSIEAWEVSGKGLGPERFANRVRKDTRGLLEVVTLDKHSQGSRPDTGAISMGDTQVRFIHDTVKTFLCGEKGLGLLQQEFQTHQMERSHLYLFRCCMWALDRYSLREESGIGFLDYATEFWPLHARAAGDTLGQDERLPDFLLDCGITKTARVMERHKTVLRTSQSAEFRWLDRWQPNMTILLATMGCTSLLRRHLDSCPGCRSGRRKEAGSSGVYRSAMSNAITAKHMDAAMVLLESCGVEGSVHAAKKSSTGLAGLIKTVASLHQQAESEDQGLTTKTLLYEACYFTDLDLVRFLLSHGADASVPSPTRYEFPLHVAIALGDEKLVETLMGPNVPNKHKLLTDPRFEKNWTALHAAVASQQPWVHRLRILRTLLRVVPQGAGLLGLRDEEGKTPIELAGEVSVEKGRGEMLEVLRDYQAKDSTNLQKGLVFGWEVTGSRILRLSVILVIFIALVLSLER